MRPNDVCHGDIADSRQMHEFNHLIMRSIYFKVIYESILVEERHSGLRRRMSDATQALAITSGIGTAPTSWHSTADSVIVHLEGRSRLTGVHGRANPTGVPFVARNQLRWSGMTVTEYCLPAVRFDDARSDGIAAATAMPTFMPSRNLPWARTIYVRWCSVPRAYVVRA